MTTPKEQAEMKVRELFRKWTEDFTEESFITTYMIDELQDRVASCLLEFSQGSTVVPSYEEINEAANTYLKETNSLIGISAFNHGAWWMRDKLSHPTRVVVPESVSDEEIEKLAIDWCDKNTDAYEYFPDKSAWVAGYRAALSKDSAKREGV
jgi:hypothetical protein